MQPFKAPRLSRSKGNGRLSTSSRDSGQTFKASYEDLRNPDGRISLRNHFTGAFPEAQMRPSLESMNSFDTDSRPALSRSTSYTTTPHQNSTVASSPSSDSLTAAGSKRLAIVQEQSVPVDVAQAIKLLEELKKTATAAELVALHKALLPSRSPRPEDDQMPALIRRKSMLPPGVASRNASGDLIKTPEEAAAESRRRGPSPHTRTMTAPAPDHLRSVPDHCESPDNMIVHMGAYGPGTLRITNGAASPAPSTLREDVRQSVEHFETAPSTPVGIEFAQATTVVPSDEFHLDNAMAANLRSNQSRPTTRDGPRKLQKPDNAGAKRERRSSEPSRSGIPVPEAKDVLSPRAYRPSRPEKRHKSREQSRETSQSRTRSWFSRSRRSSNSQHPAQVAESVVEQRPSKEIHVSHTPLRVVVAQEVLSSEPTSASEELITPTAEDLLRPNRDSDLPRFAQRLSYRMSQLPPDATSQLPSTPDDGNATLASLAQRLSNVSNRSSGGDSSPIATGPENPEAALARLNGTDATQSPSKHDSADVAIVVDAAMETPGHRPLPDTADSGYGSEISNPATRPMEAREAGRVYNPANQTRDAHIPKAHKDFVVGPDQVSLYSFNQLLKSPHLLSGPTTPSAPNNGGNKKHLSLLGIHITKKEGASHARFASSDANLPEVVPVSSGDQQLKAHKKKLQKAFPASVKREIKAQKKQAETQLQRIDMGIVPSVPDDVRTSFSRHSQQMDSMTDPNALQYFGTDPADYVTNGPAELSGDTSTGESPQPIASQAVASMRLTSLTGESQNSGMSGGEATIVPRGHPRFRERFASTTRSVDVTPGRSEFGNALLHEIKPKIAKPFTGMEDSAASLFARRRSRDFQQAQIVLAPAALSRTASSVYDTAMPPMPHLPENSGPQLSKMDEAASERHGIDGSDAQADAKQHEIGHQGYSTESVADAVKRAVKSREPAGYSTESVADVIRKMQKSNRKSKSKRKTQKQQLREEHELPAEEPESAAKVQPESDQTQTSPSDTSDITAGWEDEANAWRKRRQTVGETLSKRASEEPAQAAVQVQRNRASTSSIHTIPRKPVPSTRNSAEPSISHQRSDSAETHAETYRDLISLSTDERPSYDGVGWRDSTGTFATMHDDDGDESRVDSAHVAHPGAVLLLRSTYQPRPSTDSELIRQCRDHSLAKLTGAPTYSAKASLDFPCPPFRQRKTSFNSLIVGRYSGGSDLGLEGVGGSAGMGAVGDRVTGRGLSEEDHGGLCGVDMSDVPLWGQQVHT